MTDDKEDALQDAARDALLDAIKPQFPEPNRVQAIKERLMHRVAAERPASEPDARGLLTVRADEGNWKAFLPNVSIKVLRREQDTLTYLLKLEPGAALLPHDHPHDEECIVLSGEARIGDLVVRAGDYHCAYAGKPHGVITSEQGAVLFLRGAVPAANQVRWNASSLATLAKASLRKFVDRW
jgi:quercetin dioxygenase-like cupin family protein